MEDILAILIVCGGGVTFLISFTPIGKAIAARIRGGGAQPMRDPELLAEVDALRQELSELHERVDFTERLLASQREPERLAGS